MTPSMALADGPGTWARRCGPFLAGEPFPAQVEAMATKLPRHDGARQDVEFTTPRPSGRGEVAVGSMMSRLGQFLFHESRFGWGKRVLILPPRRQSSGVSPRTLHVHCCSPVAAPPQAAGTRLEPGRRHLPANHLPLRRRGWGGAPKLRRAANVGRLAPERSDDGRLTLPLCFGTVNDRIHTAINKNFDYFLAQHAQWAPERLLRNLKTFSAAADGGRRDARDPPPAPGTRHSNIQLRAELIFNPLHGERGPSRRTRKSPR